MQHFRTFCPFIYAPFSINFPGGIQGINMQFSQVDVGVATGMDFFFLNVKLHMDTNCSKQNPDPIKEEVEFHCM